MKKLFELFGAVLSARRSGGSLVEGYTPYADRACNLLYNLLFCDKLKLFDEEAGKPLQGDWPTLLAKQPYAAALRSIADDQSRESRLRLLAFNRLREIEQPVPKLLLGVVIELGMPEGLDVLAAYPDGRVRYINHKEKIAAYDPVPAKWMPDVRKLMSASQAAIERIGPWHEPRIAPPTAGMVRMTFLVADGLYFGQGRIAEMEKEPMAQPIIAAGVALLKSIARDTVRDTR